MPYRFVLTATIPASAGEIYEAWLDSRGHSAMTGGDAKMSDRIGAQVSAWDGYITGRNLELMQGQRIVQSWRTAEFTDEQPDSIVTVVLRDVGADALLTLEHSNVPDEQTSYEESGWQSHYFEPMVAYFAGRKRGTAERGKAAAKGASKLKRSPRTQSKRVVAGTRRRKSRGKAVPAGRRAKVRMRGTGRHKRR